MRLSFCFPTPERIEEGVRRLSTVLKAELDTVTMFGNPNRHTDTGVETPNSNLR